MIFLEAILNFDLSVFDFVSNHIIADWLSPIMKVLTILGDGWFFPIIAVILLIPKKTRKVGAAMLGGLLVMLVINNYILKPVIARPRPFNLLEWDGIKQYPALAQKWAETYVYPNIISQPHSYSFPSGHTSSSFAAATAVALSTKNGKISVPAFILAAIIGFTRIYMHVHYCTDVLAGAVLGVVYGIVGYFVAKYVMGLIEKAMAKRAAKKA